MGRMRLADALTDFGIARFDAELTEARPAAIAIVETPPPPAPFDPSEMIADAVRRAEDALRATLQAEHQAELAALHESHADELAALASRLSGETAARIGVAVTELESHVLQVTTDAVARLISPVLTHEVTRRSLAMLSEAVTAALADGAAIRLRVSGPRPLFDQLASALGERAATVQFEERDGFDLTVSIDDMLYETRLGEWSSSVREMLQ